jgi:hypothetical protein
MKKTFWFIVLTTILGSFIYYYVEGKVENEKILAELKEEIDENNNEDILQVVDGIILNINEEKNRRNFLLDSLDLIIEDRTKTLKESNVRLEKNEQKIIFLELEKKKIEKEKEELDKIIMKNDSTLMEIEKSIDSLNKIYNRIIQEKIVLEEKYSELLSKYDGSKFIEVDSIYQIDTIFFKSEDIKKIKLKN